MRNHRATVLITALIGCLALTGCARKGPHAPKSLSDAEYFDKVRGEWLGKLVGGALGMPLEGWNSEDIEGTFGTVSNYEDGYFTERRMGGSPTTNEQAIPADGKWHRIRARLIVPVHGANEVHVAPVIHLSNGAGPATLECEVRRLDLGNGVAGNWFGVSRGWYFHKAAQLGRKVSDTGAIALSLPPKTSDTLQLLPRTTKNLRMKAGQSMNLSIEAKCSSGAPKAGFSFDYLANAAASGFKPDDDTTYTIIGMLSLEKRGPDLTAKQIGKTWLEFGPRGVDLTLAEGQAMTRLESGVEPPESGDHYIGEAIGGQMRGEIWGLVAPGRPRLAAEYARRDAMVSHRDNGIYGEQFIAAMMATAFYERDIPTIVKTGLNHVPADSKYAGAIRLAMDLHKKYPDFHDALKELKTHYEFLSYVDVFADAGIVTLALLYGEGDFEKTILIAAACGNDTDCNAANAGALIGCIRGAKALPAKWIAPIGDDFQCGVRGYRQWSIADLSRRICANGRRVEQFHGGELRFSSRF